MRYCLSLIALLMFAQTGATQTSSPSTQEKLAVLIASDERSERHKARDVYRHPLQTLTFLGIEPDMTVVEIWPGGQGGWYRKIIEPFINDGGGRYIPVRQRSNFPAHHGDIPYEAVDMVLVFRAHGFMIYNDPAQDHVDALFAMLKPGGVLGIVDHAGDETVPQDPEGKNGYVNESHFLAMAKEAGFVLIDEAAINRNPADTKDHLHGVYSLLPNLAGSRFDPAMRAKFKAIGESDRFTLKFMKPAQ